MENATTVGRLIISTQQGDLECTTEQGARV
jgi:hypothetical protein